MRSNLMETFIRVYFSYLIPVFFCAPSKRAFMQFSCVFHSLGFEVQGYSNPVSFLSPHFENPMFQRSPSTAEIFSSVTG